MPENPVLVTLHPHALTAPVCDPPFQEARVGRARTYPERPQGVVGAVGLLPRAPVHQALQLDQQELLGSGGRQGVAEPQGLSRPWAAGPVRAGALSPGHPGAPKAP